MASKIRQLHRIVAEYQANGGQLPARAMTIAQWAIENRLWGQHPTAAVRQCAREISRAMREEYYTDPKGRRVRLKHAVTTKKDGAQITLWDDIRRAPREHMERAFQQRRQRIVGDCRQLKTDADSYNDAHPDQERIQLVFNFVNDLLELEALAGPPWDGGPQTTSSSAPSPRGVLSLTSHRRRVARPELYHP